MKHTKEIQIIGATEDEWLRLVLVFHQQATVNGMQHYRQAVDWTAKDNRVAGEYKEGLGTIFIYG